MNGKVDGLSNIAQKLRKAGQRPADRALDPLHIENVLCDMIDPNPAQPRKRFPQQSLEELAESIRQHGVMQPIVLRLKEDNRYEIIAGERRWRASKLAGMATIPARIRTVTDSVRQVLALIENIQRENLSALEEADSVALLVNEMGSQQAVATTLNKDKAYISKMCTVHTLPTFARESYDTGVLGDDAELLVNLVRLSKTNPTYAEQVVGFAKQPGDISRQYIRDMLKRANEDLPPINPHTWNARKAHVEAPTPRPAESVVVPQAADIGTHDDTYKFTSVGIGQLAVEVNVPSMRIKRAVLDLERLPDNPNQVWIVAGNARIVVDASEVIVQRVVPKS